MKTFSTPLILAILFSISLSNSFSHEPIRVGEPELPVLNEDFGAYDEDCDLSLNVLLQTCGLIQVHAVTASPPWPLVSWTVNGVSVPTLPGSVLAYPLDGPGSYEFCAVQQNTECQVCETYVVEQGCEADCGAFSFDFVNAGDPSANSVAWFAPVFEGDLSEGMIYWDFGAGSSPVLSNDSLVGYQFFPGTYEVCATYSDADCEVTYCEEIIIEDNPPAVFGCTDPDALNYNSDATDDDGSCFYQDDCGAADFQIEHTCDSIIATASNPLLYYEWTVNGEVVSNWAIHSLSYKVPEIGTYQVCCRVNFPGCEGTVYCDTVVIDESCLDGCPDGPLTAEVNDCSADFEISGTVEGSQGFTSWDFGNGSGGFSLGTSVSYPYNANGPFTVCGHFSNSTCTGLDYCVDVILPDCEPWGSGDCEVAFTIETQENGGDTLYIIPDPAIEDASTVYWDFGDNTGSVDLYPVHTYTGSGPYELCLLTLFDAPANTCLSHFCLEVDESLLGRSGVFSVKIAPGSLLSSVSTDIVEEFVLWPNPAREELNVGFQSRVAAPVQLRIFDLTGKMVHAEQINAAAGENLISLPVNAQAPGLYILQLSGNSGQQSLRFSVTD